MITQSILAAEQAAGILLAYLLPQPRPPGSPLSGWRALYGPMPVENFQRDLGAIGPHAFQEKSVWTNPLVPCFREDLYGPMALKVRQKFPLRLVLVHGWLFPASFWRRLGANKTG